VFSDPQTAERELTGRRSNRRKARRPWRSQWEKHPEY